MESPALRSLLVVLFVAGCGARTVLREPVDSSDASAPVDVPAVDIRVVDAPPAPDAPLRCEPGQTLCNGRCVDARSDNSNCGGCGRVCGDSRCVNGDCQMAPCVRPTSLCGVRCVDLSSDPANCGLCNRACAAGVPCAGGGCVEPPLTGRTFRIDRMLATGCTTAEHARATGDDRGGIALSRERVFYSGDENLGSFDADTLAPATAGGTDDGLLSDLATGQVYSLHTRGMPVETRMPTTVTELALRDGRMGVLIGRSVPLSPPIALSGASQVGVFSGYGRAVIYDAQRVYNIDLPSGVVTVLGSLRQPLAFTPCETWAFWGVAEFFDGAISLVYVADSQRIVRTRLPSGETTTAAAFENLSDMCSITVDPIRLRWYWHHEGTSQFTMGRDENIGYCDASFAP